MNMVRMVRGLAAVLVWSLVLASPSLAGDNGNGTVTVNGLVWLKNADCFGRITWFEASFAVGMLQKGACGLSDGSKRGMWRLPSLDELRQVHAVRRNGFVNVRDSNSDRDYWSSVPYRKDAGLYYFFLMNVGSYNNAWSKESTSYVWPVRAALPGEG